MSTPLKITESQLTVFRSLLRALAVKTVVAKPESQQTPFAGGAGGLHLIDNFRPVQPIFERNVTFYDASLGSPTATAPSVLVMPFNFRQRMQQMPAADQSTPWAWSTSTISTLTASRTDSDGASSHGLELTGNRKSDTSGSCGRNSGSVITLGFLTFVIILG